jgi:spore coat protein SA
MPNALLEAMSMGKASIATSVNGAPELVEDGVSGFLVEPENPHQIVEKLHNLLTNDNLRKSIEMRARTRVESHFTYEKMTDRLEKLFQMQIKNKGNAFYSASK